MWYKKFIRYLTKSPMQIKHNLFRWWEIEPCPYCNDRLYLSFVDNKYYLCCVNAKITQDSDCDFKMYSEISYKDVIKQYKESTFDKQ